jgi:uncharacterized protein YjbJ (UPF0337 family)
MSDDIQNKDDAKGRVKEAAGSLTGDERLKREGKVVRATGKLKEGVDRAREALTGREKPR